MHHVPSKHSRFRRVAATRLRAALLAAVAATALTLLAATPASALTLVSPESGHHFDYVQVNPTVSFDPATGDKPKYVVIASDSAMKQSIRYCRQFTWVVDQGAYHWGCRVWATGADAFGGDIVKPLDWNKTYYWNVTYTDSAGTDHTTEARAFTIDDQPPAIDPNAISDKIFGSVVGDGTTLNLGNAAFVNSGVKVTDIHTRRIKPNRFVVDIAYQGSADLSHSFVTVRGGGWVRNLKLQKVGNGRAKAVWVRSTAERTIAEARYQVQGHLSSVKNGALVKSELRVVLIRKRTT